MSTAFLALPWSSVTTLMGHMGLRAPGWTPKKKVLSVSPFHPLKQWVFTAVFCCTECRVYLFQNVDFSVSCQGSQYEEFSLLRQTLPSAKIGFFFTSLLCITPPHHTAFRVSSSCFPLSPKREAQPKSPKTIYFLTSSVSLSWVIKLRKTALKP